MQTILNILQRAGVFRPTLYLKIENSRLQGFAEAFTDAAIRG